MKFIIINKKIPSTIQHLSLRNSPSKNKKKKSTRLNCIHLVFLMFNLTLLMSNWMQFSPIEEESKLR
jgi:uncharacterized membrane protein